MSQSEKANRGLRASKATRNSNRAGLLASVAQRAFDLAGATEAAVAAVRAAGIGERLQAETRRKFIIGQLARLLNPAATAATDTMFQAAEAVLDKAGEGRKPKEGQGVRTAAEERAYDTARYHWSRILKLADVQSADKRGSKRGAKKRGEGKGGSPSAAPAAPRVNNRKEFVGWYVQQAALLRTFFDSNASVNANIAPAELATLLEDFTTKLRAIAAKEG